MVSTTRPRRRAYALRLLGSLGVWAILALIAWLDSDRCALALRPGIELHQAWVFSLIVNGIQLIAGWLATAATVTVTWLANTVAWLALRVGSILKSTGAMFARVWDGTKILWSDVLKPGLHWLDTQLTRVHDWLRKTFQPVFAWLKRVRDVLTDVYRRYVRPIIDTIEFIRAVNRVLLTFHVKVLKQVDAVLQKIEQRIDEPFLWIYARLNQIWNFLDQILTLGGLFQRVTLIKSLEAYWPDWVRTFWEKQGRLNEIPIILAPELPPGLSGDPAEYGSVLGDLYRGEPTILSGYVDELVPLWRDAAGLHAGAG